MMTRLELYTLPCPPPAVHHAAVLITTNVGFTCRPLPPCARRTACPGLVIGAGGRPGYDHGRGTTSPPPTRGHDEGWRTVCGATVGASRDDNASRVPVELSLSADRPRRLPTRRLLP